VLATTTPWSEAPTRLIWAWSRLERIPTSPNSSNKTWGVAGLKQLERGGSNLRLEVRHPSFRSRRSAAGHDSPRSPTRAVGRRELGSRQDPTSCRAAMGAD